MYLNNVTIAVNVEANGLISSLINSINYKKIRGKIKDNKAYYELIDTQWVEGFDKATDALIAALSNLQPEAYAFVRMGNDYDDTEIHGTIENFGITITRTVSY